MARKKTPPEYGESPGPMIVACQWNCAAAVVSMACRVHRLSSEAVGLG